MIPSIALSPQLKTVDKRGALRRRVSIPLRFSDLKTFSNKIDQKAFLVDVSTSGARIESGFPLEVNQWVEFEDLAKANLESEIKSVMRQTWKTKGKIIWTKIQKGDSPMGTGKTIYIYGIQFIQKTLEGFKFDFHKLIPRTVLALLFLGTLNVFYLKWFNLYFFWYSPVLNTYSVIISLYILSRFLFATFYRSPKDQGYFPRISVIIACKNEEDSIRRTIDCVYEADYPSELLEVVVVNDGSTDGTLEEMNKAKAVYPSLRVVDFKENRGKRHGMAVGAEMAVGDILVYIDSDSFIRRDGLYNIVQGFTDRTVGAICGHANVSNVHRNILTKMQEVRYFVAFRVIKAAESIFSAVTCCSGCFSAYRREYVMPILPLWLNQTFLGEQATFGDDRSLTNFMLRKYRVIYHSEAVCSTMVPESYMVFFRQQLRWKKSWMRESLLACQFMWKRHPVVAFFFYCGVVFPLIAPMIVLSALVLPLMGLWPFSFLYVYGATLMAILYSLVYFAYHRNGLWIWGVTFSFFYMLVLVWQTYYAFFTVKRNHWGTR